MAKLRHLLMIFLLTLFLVPSFASIAQVRADNYTPGPVFALSNGHTLTVQFAGFSFAAVSNLTAALNVYVPKLLQVFYEPSVDYTVTISHGDSCVGNIVGCAGTGFIYLTHNWDSTPLGWPDQVSILVREFTHTLQFAPNGPASVLQDDADVFYVEPTAFGMQDILDPQPTVDNPHVGYYLDSALASADYGVGVATNGYRGIETNPPAPTDIFTKSIWLSLYRADHGIFKKVNNLLSQLAQQGGPQIKADGFREVIRQSLSLQTLDGLPVRQWLSAEGILTRDEVVSSSTEPIFTPSSYEDVSVWGKIDVDGGKSNAIFHDAVNRIPIGESAYDGAKDLWGFDFGHFSLRSWEYVHSASRVDVHLVTSTAVYDRSFLLPQFNVGTLSNWSVDDAFENAVVLATPDGWLLPVNGTARVNGQPWPVVNGVLRFTTATPTVNIDLPDGRRIENFVTYGTLMVLGAFNLTELQLMHDTDQIRPATTAQMFSTTYYASDEPHFKCIIATAAYGSEMAPEVIYMRYVRDRVVGSTPIGRKIVDWWNWWYYLWSPPIAAFISDKPWLRAVFRILLIPVSISVRAADLTFNTSEGGNFGSVIAFLFAAMISTLAYVALPILVIRLTSRALTFAFRSGSQRLLRLRRPR
jgi:hypothetical protein